MRILARTHLLALKQFLLSYQTKLHQPECWDGKPLGRTKQGNLMALLSVNRLQSDILRELWLGATNRVYRIARD